MQRNVVLLLTHSGDYFTVDRVAEALLQRGAQPFRLDSDRFPMTIRLSARFGSEGMPHRIEYGEHSISTDEVQAVWMRRIWQARLSEELDARFQESCIRESMATLHGFLDSLSEVRWVDDLQRISAAENKLRQLRIAKKVGLQIPRTLVTNDPQEVRDFFHQVKGKMVAKLLKPLSSSMEGSSFFVYTSAVREKDLRELDSLRYSPMVFQEEIPKQREFRVAFVAGNFFVGALNADRYSGKTMDWRRNQSEDCPWERDELPSDVARCLTSLMAEFGLSYGAIDLIVTPDGECVFLEVNPSGEWGMLEKDLDYPISAAIAEALLS